MSVVKVVYLICDQCEIAQERVGMKSVAEAREVARDGGWKRRGHLDLCDACAGVVGQEGEKRCR